jgi:cubilin
MFINIKPRTETGHGISVFVFYCLFDILKFQDFSVEKERDCSYDSLSVFERTGHNDSLIRKMCGPSYPNRITSTTNTLYMMFHSNESGTDVGFNITYNVHDIIRKC